MKLLLSVILTMLLLTGCSYFKNFAFEERDSDLVDVTYNAAEQLLQGQNKLPLVANNKNVLVATIANLNDLETSSAFGRLLSEQISSRIAQLGIQVTELKLRGSLFVSEREGEMVLSREVRDLSRTHNTDAVIAGTYTDAGKSIYVNLKLVRTSDAVILNAYNFEIKKTPSIDSLL